MLTNILKKVMINKTLKVKVNIKRIKISKNR